ncbi:MAG: hypothetical protein CMN78_04385 [Spirochaetales bacterium]|nr:hypothetical protein [Spirochaetales bacterium]
MDGHQRKAVDCNRNAVVSAGAGSGKTTVLAERFVRLVREGRAGVENILTLTFTRKAAREMHSRIYELMLRDRDNPKIAEQLPLFHNAQISTLDSFCSQIARNWSQRFGISSDFRVDEEAATRSAEGIALQFMLEKGESEALGQFVYANGFETVHQGYFTSLAVADLSLARPLDFSTMWANQESFLEGELRRKTAVLLQHVGVVQSLDATSAASIRNAQKSAVLLVDIEDLSERKHYDRIESLLSACSFQKPGNVKQPDLIVLKDLIDLLRQIINELMNIVVTLGSGKLLDGIFNLSGEFQERVIDARRTTGAVFYHDVVSMALTCLLENHELRDYYKSKFSFIMIDEFQDNNRLQRDLLYLLAEKSHYSSERVPYAGELEPQKLFFVGDEKQSIYQFRGADVSVFKELADEISSNAGESVTLPRNYRAEPELIEFYNRVFSRVMAGAERPFEARFEGLESRDSRLPEEPTIEILFKPAAQETDSDVVENVDAEAIAVARYIERSVKNNALQIAGSEGLRPAEYHDFAILMRSTSNQNRFERALRLLNIPYTVQNIRSLFMEAPANDLYCILQLAVYPRDKTSYATVLRSPFVNLSDDAVIRVLLEDRGPFDPALRELPFLREDRAKMQRGEELFGYVRDNADVVPLAELLFTLWYRFGYRYYLLRSPSRHPHLEYYDYLAELARRADRNMVPLAQFLDEIRPHLGRYERIPDLDTLKEESAGVQIMTIHRAKGLEFPVVILANAGNMGKNSRIDVPYFTTDQFGITVNLKKQTAIGSGSGRYNYFYTMGRDEQREKERAELKRLLYVALTRAQYHLVISGCHNRNNRSNDGNLLNMVLVALGWEPGTDVQDSPSLSRYIKEIPEVPQTTLYGIKKIEDDSKAKDLLRRYRLASVPVFARKEIETTATEIDTVLSVHQETGRSLSPIDADKVIQGDELEAAFGTLCHLVISRKILKTYSPQTLPVALREQFPDTKFPMILRSAEFLAEGFLGLSMVSQAISTAHSVESELQFLLRDEAKDDQFYIRGIIDLLIELNDRTLIFDFKTNKAVSPGAYHHQLNIYRSAVKEWTDKKVECYLVYLRGSEIIEVPEPPSTAFRDMIDAFFCSSE